MSMHTYPGDLRTSLALFLGRPISENEPFKFSIEEVIARADQVRTVDLQLMERNAELEAEVIKWRRRARRAGWRQKR